MLKSITFNAITQFTIGGLLDFVAQAPLGEDGLRLSVDFADTANSLRDEEINLVREAMAAKYGELGRFDYVLVRDAEYSSFDSDSD